MCQCAITMCQRALICKLSEKYNQTCVTLGTPELWLLLTGLLGGRYLEVIGVLKIQNGIPK